MLTNKLLLCIMLLSLMSTAEEYKYTYNFFTNSAMRGDYFFSRTVASGKSTILTVNRKLPVSDSVFHSPGNSLVLNYKNSTSGNWKAIIYHQEKRGMDHFKKGEVLSFWILNNSTKTPADDLPAVQLMRRDSTLLAKVSIPEGKTTGWQQVTLPLTSFGNFNPHEPGEVIAIVFSQQKSRDCSRQIIFVDDIEYLCLSDSDAVSSLPVITSATGYAMHVDITWQTVTDKNIHMVQIYRSDDGKNFKPVGIQQPYINRYADFTGETGKKYSYKISFLKDNYKDSKLSSSVIASTKPMTDDELLTMVQEASFRYYWEGAEPNSGMARENIPGRDDMIATGASGFGIMALLVGTERGFITREESVARSIRILGFLEKAETFHGVYPHFMDGPSGKVVPFFGHRDNGADLVETSFLIQGLLAARQYFHGENSSERQIREEITSIWEKAEWAWFRQRPDSKFLYWHWSPDQGWVINHNLIGWNEVMVTYLLAIASPSHPVPASMYYSGWANQESTGQKYRSAWGRTKDGSMYTNGNTYFGIKLDVGVSNGGPLFFTHYSFMGYDPHAITDKYTNYFINNQNIAKINYRYCVQNPKHFKGYGENGWGLTASDGPYNYSADEPVPSEDHGKLAPTGAISSFPYTPEESMKALKNYYFMYGKFLWGEYGFRDAFDLTNNWCSEIYMGLNQAPMTVMIENYRTGLLWKLFMSCPEIQSGLKKLESSAPDLKKEK